jgi:hypothetical protein
VYVRLRSFLHLIRKNLGANVSTFFDNSTEMACLHKIPLVSNNEQVNTM